MNKPDPRIFEFAMTTAQAQAHQSLMIGDNLDADIRGAANVGMDAIFFNPNIVEKPADVSHMIIDLKELQSIL